MDRVKQALEVAHGKQIAEIYAIFEGSILIADGNHQDIHDAEAKFKFAVIHANHVLAKALAIADGI